MTVDINQVADLVSKLFTNENNLGRTFFNMFYSKTPQDINLEFYDEAGVLQTYTLPNRAKDFNFVKTGSGSPESVVIANLGTFYLDLDNLTLYLKTGGSASFGWVETLNAVNFLPGVDYLTPTGNGAQLTSLNADNISLGVLPVLRGGTGSNTFTTDLIKGNGTNALINATPGTDYITPSTGGFLTDLTVNSNLVWHKGNNSQIGFYGLCAYNATPAGWLRCNGSQVSRITYADLFAVIGTTYGAGNGTTTFNLPDARGEFFRGWDDGRGIDTGRILGSWQEDMFKSHNHLSFGGPNAGFRNSDHNGGTLFQSIDRPTTYTGGVETRPRNISTLVVLKYI